MGIWERLVDSSRLEWSRVISIQNPKSRTNKLKSEIVSIWTKRHTCVFINLKDKRYTMKDLNTCDFEVYSNGNEYSWLNRKLSNRK